MAKDIILKLVSLIQIVDPVFLPDYIGYLNEKNGCVNYMHIFQNLGTYI